MKSSTFFRALLLGGLLTAGAVAVPFGALNVTPRGPQNLNLETGVTELPQGGTATDSKAGLTLSAARMQLKAGEQLSAQNATLKFRGGGTLSAAQVTYNVKAQTVTATGSVRYSDARFRNLTAGTVRMSLGSGFITATGGVKAENPALSSPTVVFDPHTVQALVMGPAQLSQGTLKTGMTPGGKLLVLFSGPRISRVTSKVDAGTLARFTPYLP